MPQNILNNLEHNYVSLQAKDLLIHFLKTERNLDFSEYSEASVRRRISKILSDLRILDVENYIEYLREEDRALEEFVEKFTVNVTEMFRDPAFYQTLAKKVLPVLKDKERIKIWSAGCSTGEEVLSLAIMLKEEGLLDRSIILGTDLSEKVLKTARKQCYDLRHIPGYEKSYLEAGGKYTLDKYYAREGAMAKFDESLYHGILYEKHNLINDSFRNGFDLVICRNVLIYFNPSLQDKVIGKFYEALHKGGHLVLGAKESAVFYHGRSFLSEIETQSSIYQKMG